MLAGGGATRRATCAAVGLVLLLHAPLAQADDAGFTADGTVFLPGGSLRLSPLAVFVNGTLDLEGLTLTSTRVTVDVTRTQYPEVSVPGLNVGGYPAMTSARYDLSDVTLHLVPGAVHGLVGIYPRSSSDLAVSADGLLNLTARSVLHMGDGSVDQGPDGAAGSPAYARVLTGPVLDVWAGGTLTFEGPGAVKLNGPSFVLDARENSTRFDTGRRITGESPGVRQVQETFVLLTFEDATLTLQHPRAQLAGLAADLAWEGVATVERMRGQIRTGDAVYGAEGQRVELAGVLRGEARAVLGPDDRAVALVRVEGDLASTSLSPSSRSFAPAPAWRPWWLGALVAVSVAAGVSGALAYGRRRARGEGLSVEQYRDLADAAMENLRFADALGWIQKAQAIAPASARLWMDRGYCHASLGDVPEALAAYARASELSSDGEADLLAASLLLRAGQVDLDAAERHVERALQRSPEMAIEVQLDSVFDPLRARPRFLRLLRRALGDRGARGL